PPQPGRPEPDTDQHPRTRAPAGRAHQVCRSPSTATHQSPPPPPEPYTPATAQPALHAAQPDQPSRTHNPPSATHPGDPHGQTPPPAEPQPNQLTHPPCHRAQSDTHEPSPAHHHPRRTTATNQPP